MVTLYLAATGIRLESKIAIGKHILEKYRKFKEETPKEFYICKTKKGCSAHLTQYYSGKDVVEQAIKLDRDNENIIKFLSTMKTQDELNLNSCVRVLKKHGHELLADWVYRKLAPVLETQDKQKSVDKVEPKFHKGDWTISNLDGKARQISEVHYDEYNSYYVVDGKSVNLEEYDRLHHLWTIQDAKDGDVLATKSENVFIFKGLLDRLRPKSPVAYCGNNGLLGFFISASNNNRWTDEAVVPATKEQCDLLFQKMKKAGYTFDFDKKELKKIEQKSV